jgi:hypothetical protein
MIYQLGTLDKWTRQEIIPEALRHLSEAQLKANLDFAICEKESICTYFRDRAIGKPPTPTLKFIQAHQVGVSTIIDIVASYSATDKFSLSQPIQDFYHQVCLILEGIIQFLQHHLSEFFDDELLITQTNAKQSRIELGKKLKQLEALEQNILMDKALFRITTRPIREFIEERKQVSYSELNYLKELANCLQGIIDLDTNVDLTYEFHLTLWELNFNFPRYVLHFNYWLDAKLSTIADRTERLDKLSWYIHAIEQMKVKPGFIFIPNLPPLSEQLFASIKTTYRYLLLNERKVDHTVVEKINQGGRLNGTKIKLSISVPVLALSLKILVKAGIIVNENKAEVFRTISENFTTVKSEQISYDSLRGKYTKTPTVAYVQLRNILMRMLDILKQY